MLFQNKLNKKEQFLHGGNVYAKMRETGAALEDILDFSANINPLGLSQSVRQAVREALEAVVHYPDPEGGQLKEALSLHYGVDRTFITLGNGATELIYILSHLVKPRQVLVPAPTFSEYERAAKAAGAKIKYCPLLECENFSLKTDRLIENMGPGEMTFICNPNNPTGALLQPEELIPVLDKAAEQNSLVVIDESFIDFLEDSDKYTCRQLLKEYPNLVIVHSLTKFFAIPGLRLGFAMSSPPLAAAMHKAKDPWNVNSLAQCAGTAALADREYQTRSRKLIVQAKEELYQNLRNLPGFRPYAPTVNYILINLSQSGFFSSQLCGELAKQKILLRDCSNYPGLSSDYIRVAVKMPAQNSVLLSALRSALCKS